MLRNFVPLLLLQHEPASRHVDILKPRWVFLQLFSVNLNSFPLMLKKNFQTAHNAEEKLISQSDGKAFWDLLQN